MQKSLVKKHLFEAFGIELEYMIVDRSTLNVKPITDQLFFSYGKTYDSEIVKDPISWNNELALHVLELKTTAPTRRIDLIHKDFTKEIRLINRLLEPLDACLMPTAMHPWMNPNDELKLWPHGDNPWYREFDRIFNCKGHGWANLQSMHINFPFADEEEFVRLHAAIRLVLPIIPAIAASSPIIEGKLTGFKDSRLNVYKTNSKKIPSITGEVIPEAVLSFDDYRKILNRIGEDLSSEDTDKVLDPEWTNSRGAIARFERDAIEVRLIDTQESAFCDLAVSHAVIQLVKWLSDNHSPKNHDFDEKRLKLILEDTIKNGEASLIQDSGYLSLFEAVPCTAHDLWKHVLDNLIVPNPVFEKPLENVLTQGSLSSRIEKAVGSNTIKDVYRELCQVLNEGRIFHA